LSVDTEIRRLLEKAKAITEPATKESRALTPDENKTVKGYLDEIENLKAERDSVAIRSNLVSTGRFATVARDILEQGKSAHKLNDVLAKATTITEPNSRTTRIEPGIQPLPAGIDPRFNLYQLMPRADIGNAVAVQDYKLTARSTSGTIERDPFATTAKAGLSLTIAPVTLSVRQFALMMESVPVQLVQSEAGLVGLFESELRKQLNISLDSYVAAQILASNPDHGGVGQTTVEGKVRVAMNDLQDNGFTPDLVVINPSDAADVDLRVNTTIIEAWPFGMRVVVSKDVAAGAPYVMDTSALTLFVGSANLASDPYAGADGQGFRKNLISYRYEFNALMNVRDKRGIVIASATAGYTT